MSVPNFIPAVRQVLKGGWTNDPRDANYGKHWKRARNPAPDERIEAVYPAQMPAPRSLGPIRPSNEVNVVVTDRCVYVDTPTVERLGAVASVAGKTLDRSGASQPLCYPREQVTIQAVAGQQRVQIGLPDGRTMIGKTDLHIGASGDMSAGEQVQNLWRILKR